MSSGQLNGLARRLAKAELAANPRPKFTELPYQVYSDDGALLYETPAERVKPGTIYKVYYGFDPDDIGSERE